MVRLEQTVDDLLLDSESPRTGNVETQAADLEAIVRLDAKHFKTMMGSIAQYGLDPGDFLYIIQEAREGDGYTVVDGNRRHCQTNGAGARETLLRWTLRAIGLS